MSDQQSKLHESGTVFRVLFEDVNTKVLTQPEHSYEVPVATHHVDINHPSSSGLGLNSTREDLVQISESSILEVKGEREEHVITEVNSPGSCLKRKKQRGKRGKYNADDCYPEKFQSSEIRVKKEKDVDASAGPKKRFSRSWFQLPEFSKWLEESPIPGYALCTICRKDLLPGKSELLKHANTAKHKRKIESIGRGTKEDPINQRTIDLRSDNATLPNREMRDAMREAVVGDDSFGEDPTVTELEEKVSKLLSKESGLFVPSGTMANLICVLTHCWNRGSVVILGDQSYMYRASQGCISELKNLQDSSSLVLAFSKLVLVDSSSVVFQYGSYSEATRIEQGEFGGVSQRTVRNLPDGTFLLTDLKDILKTYTPAWPTSTLICIENTHTRMGGKALPLDWLNQLGSLCNDYGILIHLDGARLINASAAIGSSPSKLSYHCSSVAFCLDKGLGAPGGCVISSSKDFIERARIIRKSLGGTIHQAGVIAAACLYGLSNFVSRISKDHSNAKAIAKAVCSVNSSAITVDVNATQTNIIHLLCDNIRVNPEQLCNRLREIMQEEAVEMMESIIVRVTPIQPNIVRLVTHGNLLMEDIRAVIRKLQYVIAEYDNFFVIAYDEL